jgi:hypothetical protein
MAIQYCLNENFPVFMERVWEVQKKLSGQAPNYVLDRKQF